MKKEEGERKRTCYESGIRKLSRRMMTTFELKNYLKKCGYNQDEINPVIEEFLELGYLNDLEYATRFCEYSFEKNKGKIRIFSELKRKGIEDEIASIAYEEASEKGNNEYERAIAETEKILKFENTNFEEVISEKLKGKIARKLNSYGYERTIIYKILDKLK